MRQPLGVGGKNQPATASGLNSSISRLKREIEDAARAGCELDHSDIMRRMSPRAGTLGGVNSMHASPRHVRYVGRHPFRRIQMKAFRRRISDSVNGPTTFIAKGSKITGKLTGEGAYIFCGEMEGDCDIKGPVTLAEGGHWTGTLRATEVVIAGTVDGDVIASKRVEIAGSARIAGSLSGHSIAVAEGAIIEGEIKVANSDGPSNFHEKRLTEVNPKPDLA
jgi:cytoskeletal protein CcmA (bactofilin family)